MARVKRGLAKHKRKVRTLKSTKGYFGGRSKLFRTAREARMRALAYAFEGRKQRKRQFRALWIARINAGARENGISYSRLIDGLNKNKILLNRKVLANLAVSEKAVFTKIVETIRPNA